MSKRETVVIGKNAQRIDAAAKVTGAAPYPGDVDMPGQLWMKIKYSDRAHARVLKVDTSAAEALPGVVRVFTSLDVPVNEYGLVVKDQPVLVGPGGDKPGTDVARCYMDNIALVVAESDAIAAQALKLIAVEYEDLPPVFSPAEAMAEGAPQLHPNNPGNIQSHFRIRLGDMQAGWDAADIVIEGEFQTGYQEHAYLQPEAGLGYIDEAGRVTVLTAGQWVHEDQVLIAHALNIPEDQVRVIYPAIGGAFGGREDMSVQIVLGLAVWYLRRPVKIVWSREESIKSHHKRHPVSIRMKWGATSDGRLTALEATVIGDAGGYNYTSNKVLANSHMMVAGPYAVPNAHVDTYAVYTNNIPTGAFRGFGAPQACFAAESMMSRMADALKIDPITIRLRNCLRDGSITVVGTPLPLGVSIAEVVEACARESGWTQHGDEWQRPAVTQPADPAKRRGIGFAAGYKNVGYSFGFPEQTWATVELYGKAEIEQVIVRHGAAEVGQGTHTVIVQMTAEAAGVPMEKVRLISMDTAETQTPGSVSASRMTFMAGNAVKGAAEQALEKWAMEERPAIATYQYRPPRTTPYDPLTGKSEPNFAYGYVAELAEVEVDIETGLVHVVRVVCADDVGFAINPQLVQGQIEGAVVQAIGYAVMEHLVVKDGQVRNPYLSSYLIPTVLDVPTEVKSVILENADPIGPWGARGMAEMPLIPVAGAIAAAIHDATGVWLTDLPFIPDKVVPALRAHGVGDL